MMTNSPRYKKSLSVISVYPDISLSVVTKRNLINTLGRIGSHTMVANTPI